MQLLCLLLVHLFPNRTCGYLYKTVAASSEQFDVALMLPFPPQNAARPVHIKEANAGSYNKYIGWQHRRVIGSYFL